jgi:protein-S-isoprenylcysteine O-methyltransferase Ste14
MTLVAALTCVSAFSSFGWGILYFFEKPSGLTWRAASVAVLGLFFGGWHLHAIATSTMSWWQVAMGMAAQLASAAIFWSAVRACRRHRLTAIFETDVPVRLVQDGPYRHVRHPFYASYTIFWLGGWVASGSDVALLSLAVMGAIYATGAREEERKFMRSPLAERYAAYQQRVGRWLPKLAFGGRYWPVTERSFPR